MLNRQLKQFNKQQKVASIKIKVHYIAY